MQGQKRVKNLEFLKYYAKNQNVQKVSAVPLEWEHLPTDIISKQLTKLNNPHPYRIHYLGPRTHSTLVFHKKYGKPHNHEVQKVQYPNTGHHLYRVNLQKIVNPTLIGVQTQEPHYKATLFYRAFEGMNPTLESTDQFVFNGAFESGNLDCVIKTNPHQFDLFLRIDSNTRGHIGWYFFSVKNGTRKKKIKINICNLKKPSLLYHQGMKPYTFSRQEHIQKGKQWHQSCQNCYYEKSQLRYTALLEDINTSNFFRLTFQYEFQYEYDEVFFAYCVPYTYSQLQQDILEYQKSPFVRQLTLGRTLGGLDIPLLHITNHQQEKQSGQDKKNVVITARVHPAQSNSSYMAKGLIQFLINSSKEAEQLRNNINFFIVPMLNPDGVVFGNSRTSAAGKDLNRQFLQPQPQLYPQCHQLKTFVSRLQKKGEVMLYLDLHGHSRKKNTFLYGPNYTIQQMQYYQCRFLPKLIEKINPIFRYYGCHFFITQDKKSTARAVMLNQLKIPFVYTVQSSIGLYYNPFNSSKNKIFCFQSCHWEEMGVSIGKAINSLYSIFQEVKNQQKQRKMDREKRKYQVQTSSGSRHSKKSSQIQCQFMNLKLKQGSSALLSELIKDIKSIQNMKNQEQDIDSDDHDESENLPSHKLKQFKMHITTARPRDKNVPSSNQQLDQLDSVCIVAPKAFKQQHKSEQIQLKNNFKLNKPQTSTKQKNISRGQKTIEVESYKSRKQITNAFSSGKSVQFINKIDHNRFQIKNMTVCKPRYTLATKNLFPQEDKKEVLSIPKSLQVMKKEMKKGRILIHHLEESNQRIGKRQYSSQPKRERKGPFVQTDSLKLKMGGPRRPCLSQFSQPEVHPSTFKQSDIFPFEQSSYNALDGFEVDNLAMKITTYKRR